MIKVGPTCLSSLPSIDRIALLSTLWTSIALRTGTLPAAWAAGEEEIGAKSTGAVLPGTARLSPAVAGVMVSDPDGTKGGFGLSGGGRGFTTSGASEI